MANLVPVTLLIPAERVPDAYTQAADWVREAIASRSAGAIARPAVEPEGVPDGDNSWRPGDEQLAEEIWSAGNSNSQAVYRELIARAGQRAPEGILMQATGMDGHRFAGLLGAMGRTTWTRHREHPWKWDQETGTYWIEDKVAEIFKRGIADLRS